MSCNFTVPDDGLAIAEIGPWSERKFKLVLFYADLFATSMAGKWESLVYLDLFAGSGYGRIRGTDRIVLTSSLRVLKRVNQFDKYIFCDKDRNYWDALRERVKRNHPSKDVQVLCVDVNSSTDRLIDELPTHSRNHRVLSFCFLDPFNMKNLHFKTIEYLSRRFMDFLVLVPSGVETRNELKLLSDSNKVMENFCGSPDWRKRWLEQKREGKSFELFIVEEYSRSMIRLGYIDPGIKNTILIRSVEKNLPLYRLVLYSRNPLGKKFWEQARNYSDPQRKLF